MIGLLSYFSHIGNINLIDGLSSDNSRYIEGYLETSQTYIDQATVSITRIGLTRIENDEIKPAIADSWTISPDGKQYNFHLIDKVDSVTVQSALIDSGEDWTDINIESVDQHNLKFTLKKPFAPLLASLSNPLLEMGPYIIYLQTDTDTVFKPNPEAFIVPKLSEVIFRKYPDIKSLSSSLKDRRIDGTSESVDDIKGFDRYKITLNKKPVLFCNTRQAPCSDQKWRETFFQNKHFDEAQNITITAIDNNENRKIIDDEQSNFKNQNVNYTVNWVNNDTFSVEILPERKYSLLLTGLDYGLDNDPYPFWHSSQIDYPGLNLSGINNHDFDQILERYRITVDVKQRQTYLNEINIEVDQLALVKFYSSIDDYYIINSNIELNNPIIKGYKSADHFNNIAQWTQ